MPHIFDYSASSAGVQVQTDRLLAGGSAILPDGSASARAGGSFQGFLATEEFWVDAGETNWTSRWFASTQDQGIVTSHFTVPHPNVNPTAARNAGAIVGIDDFTDVPDVVDQYETDRLVFFETRPDNPDAGGAFIIEGVDAILFFDDPGSAIYSSYNAAQNANFADVTAARQTTSDDLEATLLDQWLEQ